MAASILALYISLISLQAPLTMTSVEYVPGTDSVKVLVRLNNDLFLRDYQQSMDDDLDLHVLAGYGTFPKDMANNYVNAKISITINNTTLTGKLLSIKVIGEDVYLNMLYRINRNPRIITVRNTILNGLYTDVENLTIIRIRDLETGVKFTHSDTERSFVLK